MDSIRRRGRKLCCAVVGHVVEALSVLKMPCPLVVSSHPWSIVFRALILLERGASIMFCDEIGLRNIIVVSP